MWEATVHSQARHAILEGLRGCAPDVADGYVIEGLDGCEPDTQRAACAVAPDTEYARDRLRDLCDDTLGPETHEVAGQRLAQFADSGFA